MRMGTQSLWFLKQNKKTLIVFFSSCMHEKNFLYGVMYNSNFATKLISIVGLEPYSLL